MAQAFVWRTGVIGIARRTPRGALPLAKADARKLKRALCPIARHARTGSALLLPGVPEAENDAAALRAVRVFIPRLLARLDPGPERGGLV